MTRVHGSSTEHAHSGALNSPNAKRIHNGEEEVLVPLPVDDEKAVTEKEVSKKEAEIEPVPPEEDEVVPTPVVQEAWGSSNNYDGEEDW
jgi:hypothetical protein